MRIKVSNKAMAALGAAATIIATPAIAGGSPHGQSGVTINNDNTINQNRTTVNETDARDYSTTNNNHYDVTKTYKIDDRDTITNNDNRISNDNRVSNDNRDFSTTNNDNRRYIDDSINNTATGGHATGGNATGGSNEFEQTINAGTSIQEGAIQLTSAEDHRSYTDVTTGDTTVNTGDTTVDAGDTTVNTGEVRTEVDARDLSETRQDVSVDASDESVTSQDQDVAVDARDQSVHSYKGAAAAGIPSAASIFAVKACTGSTSFGIGGGSVYGVYGGVSFSRVGSGAVNVSFTGPDGQDMAVTIPELADMNPQSRAYAISGLGNKDKELAMCLTSQFDAHKRGLETTYEREMGIATINAEANTSIAEINSYRDQRVATIREEGRNLSLVLTHHCALKVEDHPVTVPTGSTNPIAEGTEHGFCSEAGEALLESLTQDRSAPTSREYEAPSLSARRAPVFDLDNN